MPTPTPLLMLPGMDGTGRLFAPLCARLPPEIDARPVAYPLDQTLGYAELVAYARAWLPRGSYFVLAESFSGPVALRLATERPPGLRGLIFAASFAASPLPWLPRWAHGGVRPWLFRGLGLGPRIGLGLGRCPPEVRELLRAALASVAPAVLAARAREILAATAPATDEALRELPALLLVARHDRLIGRAQTEQLLALLPRAELAELDAPHLLLQARPEEAAAQLTAWIARVSTSERA